MTLYRTIVADPPWPYENESWGVGAVGDEYATMTYEDICALPVTEWVERDAHLYLWVTNAKLLDYDYSQLINAWGFSYKTCLTWHKTACLGIGHYFRGETEHILFCTRGRAPIAPEHARADAGRSASASALHARRRGAVRLRGAKCSLTARKHALPLVLCASTRYRCTTATAVERLRSGRASARTREAPVTGLPNRSLNALVRGPRVECRFLSA